MELDGGERGVKVSCFGLVRDGRSNAARIDDDQSVLWTIAEGAWSDGQLEEC